MKIYILSLSFCIALVGCSNGFDSGTSTDSSSTPVLANCGGCDVAGKGGSLYLMQAGNNVGSMSTDIHSQAISLDGAWKGGCVAGNGSSRKMSLAVSGQTAYMVSRIYVGSTNCDESTLDMVQTQRYTFSSLGTAPVAFDANKLGSALMQVWWQPHSSGAMTALNDVCADSTQYTAVQDQIYDVSPCYQDNSGQTSWPIGISDNSSTLFHTNGSILRLGTVGGLAVLGMDGYFTK